MKILGLNHVSVAVDNIEKYRHLFDALFGLKSSEPESHPRNKVKLAFVDLGGAAIEFVEPLGQDTPISNFLRRHGPGIHHICLLVADIHQAVEELKRKNIKLIDGTPRQGAGGSQIAFIHPDSAGGILIELKQEKK
jgi:methylmalonyl-CoA epimerase